MPNEVAKSLDEKLTRMRAGTATRTDFILADAKDADMAFGIAAPGPGSDHRAFRTLPEYRAQIRAVIQQGLVDIVLMSASTAEILAGQEGLFRHSRLTPAVRANDTTDIWVVRGGRYVSELSRPFRSATLDRVLPSASLGLYSITFANQRDADLASLEAYAAFRREAAQKGFRHFLEVFNPNIDSGLAPEKVGGFVNDHIVRCLAGVTAAERPEFLKIAYNGPAAMEELASYDPDVIVGVLGGGAGTTRDAFQLLHDAQKYGARVALFGRKINQAEHPLALIELLRRIADGGITPTEAVKAYHGELQKAGLRAHRTLEQDLELTAPELHYR